jgi:hypothetical protein
MQTLNPETACAAHEPLTCLVLLLVCDGLCELQRCNASCAPLCTALRLVGSGYAAALCSYPCSEREKVHVLHSDIECSLNPSKVVCLQRGVECILIRYGKFGELPDPDPVPDRRLQL